MSEVEKAEVILPNSSLDYMVNYSNSCLIFRLFTRKFYNKDAFKSIMRTVWNPVKGVKFFYLGEKLFLAQFTEQSDKERVFLYSPRSFDKHLVLLTEYVGDLQPSSISLNLASFWIWFYDLPLKGMNVVTRGATRPRMGGGAIFESVPRPK